MFYISSVSGLINPEETRDNSRVRSNARANNTVTNRGNLTDLLPTLIIYKVLIYLSGNHFEILILKAKTNTKIIVEKY